MAEDLRPRQAIRRFDVFAEYRKQEEEARGLPADEAKGYGLWVAKVVAARVYGRASAIGLARGRGGDGEREEKERLKDGKWHLLGDEVQDDTRFDAEIVRRMGAEFYREAFEPAIRAAREAGASYEQIRDSIRREWKVQAPGAQPVRPAAKATAKATPKRTAKGTTTGTKAATTGTAKGAVKAATRAAKKATAKAAAKGTAKASARARSKKAA